MQSEWKRTTHINIQANDNRNIVRALYKIIHGIESGQTITYAREPARGEFEGFEFSSVAEVNKSA